MSIDTYNDKVLTCGHGCEDFLLPLFINYYVAFDTFCLAIICCKHTCSYTPPFFVLPSTRSSAQSTTNESRPPIIYSFDYKINISLYKNNVALLSMVSKTYIYGSGGIEGEHYLNILLVFLLLYCL